MAEPKTLFNVLGELTMVLPKLVLVKGEFYYSLEELLQAARKLVHSGKPEALLVHRTPQFLWARDGRGKIVIWQEGPHGRRPVYAEVGSEVSP